MVKTPVFKEVGHIADIDNRRVFAYRDGTYHVEGMSDSSLMPVFYDTLMGLLYDYCKIERTELDKIEYKRCANTQYHL